MGVRNHSHGPQTYGYIEQATELKALLKPKAKGNKVYIQKTSQNQYIY